MIISKDSLADYNYSNRRRRCGSRSNTWTVMRSRRPSKGKNKRSDPLVKAISAYLANANGELSQRQVMALARTFLAGGKAAVGIRRGSLKQAAAAMGFQRRMLAAARMRMAKLSRPGQLAAIQSLEFQRIHTTLVHHWERLRGYPNVVGYGAGFRFTDGLRTNERCASILVSKKLSKRELSRGKGGLLPRTLRRSEQSVSVDVIEVGEFNLHTGPADRIAPQSNPGRTATLGAFATDNATQAILGLTVLHAAGDMDEFPPLGAADPVGILDVSAGGQTALGTLLRGTRRNGIDAGVITLAEGQQPSRMLPDVGEIKFWRVLDKDADTGAAVTMFGAETGEPVHGVITNPCVYLPEHNLGPAIQVAISAQAGDSGAPLVDRDTFLLGLLVGGGETTQFFSPMGNIFHELDCDLF